MMILALDTTSEFGSIALRRNGTTLAEVHLHSSDGFSHILFDQISQLLERCSIALTDIGCFAAASGPGSFTGVRVGLTAAKGLAEALAKPVASVSNLRALATYGHSSKRAVILDARRGEIYAAVYNDAVQPAVPETVTKLQPWLSALPTGSYEFISVAGSPFREAVQGTSFAEMPWIDAPRFLASAVAKCAEYDSEHGHLVTPIEADANYVRSSDAELFWRDR